MEMMSRRLVLLRGVTAETDLMARRAQRETVRLVTVRARHASVVHLRLEERAVLVDLVADLAVRVVQLVLEKRDAIRVAERAAGRRIIGELTETRVGASARIDLTRLSSRRRA